jgi:dephospho-CoA kinase
VVIPLLFETRAETEFDRVICIACSNQSQQQRLLSRGWPPGEIGQRVAAQWPVSQKMERSHFVLWSEGEVEVMRQQLFKVVEGCLGRSGLASRFVTNTGDMRAGQSLL